MFDIEVDERDPDKLVEMIAALEPTFGGINLEDIKAPECFDIERKLRERMKIPVFHDDQHGTAIIVGAAVLQRAAGGAARTSARSSWSASGAGAAALACVDLLVDAGPAAREHLRRPTSRAWSTTGRTELMDANKARYASDTSARTLADVHRRRRRLPRPVAPAAC